MQPQPHDPTYEPSFVATLIAQTAPALAHEPVARLSHGWDCDVFTLGEAYVVRVARNLSAAEGIVREAKLLPQLAARLPLPIPRPVHLRVPVDEGGTCFGVYQKLPGHCLADVPLLDDDYAQLAPALGAFVRSLHAFEPPGDLDLPGDLWGRLDPSTRSAPMRTALAQLAWEGGLSRSQHVRLEAALDLAERTELTSQRVLVHADLHPWNMLIGEDGFTGIIDWVDAHLGHPALDLAMAYLTVPPSAQPALFAAYGPLEDSTLVWARFRAISWLTTAITGSRARNEGSAMHDCVARLAALASVI
jgi:aminoglycoside phosphotransferase (APT) family kinase protein